MKKTLIYGAGEYAKIFYNRTKSIDVIDVAGFTVDKEFLRDESLYGLPVVSFEQVELIFPQEEYNMLVISGFTKMRERKKMYNKAKTKGYELINYIDPEARIDDFPEMGDNNIIYNGAVVGHNVKLGSGNVIWQYTSIGHDIDIGDHNIISANCVLSGYSHIGDLNFFGHGVISSGHRYIGNENLVGMGSIVTKDIDSYQKVFGNPAKVRGTHEDSGVIIITDYQK